MLQKIIYNKYTHIYGILSFILFSLSMLIGYAEENANHIYLLLKAFFILVSSVFFLLACNKNSCEKVKTQYTLLAVFVFIYEVLLLLAVGKTILIIKDYPAILNSFVWFFCSLFSIIRFRKSLGAFFSHIVKDHQTLCLIGSAVTLAVIVIILSAEPEGIRFSWDSDTFYSFIYQLGFESLYDAKKLKFYSHVSIVYSHIIILFKLLFNDIRLAFFIINALCITLASFGTVFLLKELVPDRKVVDYSLTSAIFMLSPWICGISTYHIYDYYICCLFPLLIYFVYKKAWIWVFVIGTMITFSKASGLIVFGGVCIGILLIDLISCIKNKTALKPKCFFRYFLHPKYQCFVSVAIVFFIYFKNGIEELSKYGDTTYGFNLSHIWHQIKLYSTANFMWFFMIPSTILLVRHVFRNKSSLSDSSKLCIYVMLISDLSFFAFNCICITYRMPRYMDSHIAVVLIFAATFILYISNHLIKYSAIIISVSISVISSFFTIDPVSVGLFNKINVGDHWIIDYEMTDSPTFEDSIIYNREYYSYEVLLGKTLAYVLDSGTDNEEILFSLGNQPITWGLSGGRYSYTYNDNKHYFDLFYDKEIDGLANGYEYDYYNSTEMEPFRIHYIFPSETIEAALSISDADTFCYIYMPTINDAKETVIRQKYNIINEKSFNYRGWKMNCIRFSLPKRPL